MDRLQSKVAGIWLEAFVNFPCRQSNTDIVQTAMRSEGYQPFQHFRTLLFDIWCKRTFLLCTLWHWLMLRCKNVMHRLTTHNFMIFKLYILELWSIFCAIKKWERRPQIRFICISQQDFQRGEEEFQQSSYLSRPGNIVWRGNSQDRLWRNILHRRYL